MQPVPSETAEARHGRIEIRGRGVGPPTPEAVEARAREIAETEGRAGDSVTKQDRIRALRELRDGDLELSSDEAQSDLIASSNPADLVVDIGHKVPDRRPSDEQELQEAEIMEGVREAEHERMLAGQDLDEESQDGHIKTTRPCCPAHQPSRP